jgi:hypothetical protein
MPVTRSDGRYTGSSLSVFGLIAVLALNLGTAISIQAEVQLPVKAPSTTPDVDFDGDQFADFVVFESGAVQVLYGGPTGLTATGTRRFTRADMTAAPPAKTWGTNSGPALATGDFDADGFCDLAIGDNSATVNGLDEAGAVHVLYGSASGLSVRRNQYWSQNSPGVGDVAESQDGFGTSLVAADFGRGKPADLVIGTPTETVGSAEGAGAITLLYGSPSGLTAVGSQVLTQDSRGIPGRVEKLDQFGRSVAAGDFDGSGQADLAVGVPFDSVGRADSAGGINILYGSALGLRTDGAQFLSQATPGMLGRPVPTDYFGYNLAAGHLAGRPYADLAVTVINKYGVRGAVHVIYGTRSGLSVRGNELLSYRTINIPSRVRRPLIGDQVAIANFGRDPAGGGGFDDLAINVESSIPGEDPDIQAVLVLYGASGGIDESRSQLWSQETRGVPGSEEADWFGAALAAADFGSPVGRSRFADLAIGSPQESLGRVEYTGRVHVLYGSAQGLSSAGVQVWNQRRVGQTLRDGTEFGLRLAVSGP